MKKEEQQKIQKKTSVAPRSTLRDSSGFSLLIAVLVSTLVVSIGLGIFRLALKESIISSGARESQFAIYAADTGVECALYWDVNSVDGGKFGTTTEPLPGEVRCSNSAVRIDNFEQSFLGGGRVSATTTFSFDMNEGYYAEVSIGKLTNIDGSIETVIISRGYNVEDPNNPRRVERALRVKY